MLVFRDMYFPKERCNLMTVGCFKGQNILILYFQCKVIRSLVFLLIFL